MPNITTLPNGVYLVSFASGVGKSVVYLNGIPTPSSVRVFISSDREYDVMMINPISRLVVYNFHKSGIASKKTIKSGSVFNVTPSTDGILTDRLNFIPNINVGEKPLIVNFNAYIPKPESIRSCLWEFGDGNTSSSMYPCYTYTAPGIYTVKLTVQYPTRTDFFTFDNCIEVLDNKDLILLSGEIKKYPIFGVDAVRINDRVRCIDGNNIFMPLACSKGSITIGNQGKCGDLICRGNVWLRVNAKVSGDIRTSGTITYQSDVTVTGNTLTNASISSSELPLTLPAMSNFTYTPSEVVNDVNVEPENVCELLPGKYYNYTIKRNSKLKLSAGVYYFNKLDLDVGSSMELDEQTGPIRIYINSNFSMRGRIVHSLLGAAGPRNFLVGYCGANTIFLDYGFSGTFVSPYAHLVMAQVSKEYEGCFYAKTVEVHQEATVKYIPFAY